MPPKIPNIVSTLLLFVGLFLICFFTYSNSLHNDFMTPDDEGLLLQNASGRNLKLLFLNFIPDKDIHLKIGQQKDLSYRPLGDAGMAILYAVFRNNVRGYHLTNLFLFFGCGLALFYLIHRLFRDPLLALLTSVLFLTHPINGLIVNYITANHVAIQFLLMIGGILAFIQTLENKKPVLFTSLAAVALILACIYHETAFTLPFYFALIAFFIYQRSLLETVRRCTVYFGIVLGLLLLRLHFAGLKTGLIDNISGLQINLFEFIATFTRLIIWYLEKLVSPKGIVLFWAAPVIRQDLFIWNCLFIAMLSAAIIFIWRSRARQPLFAWCLSLIIVGFGPLTLACFMQPKSGLILEPHWMFFASIGFFVSIAGLLLKLGRNRKPWVLILLCLSIIGPWVWLCRDMNTLWGRQKDYYRYWQAQAPSIQSINFWLAKAYLNESDLGAAKIYFRKSLTGSFRDWQVYSNLGVIAKAQGNREEALKNYQTALSIYPASPVTQNNLGVVWIELNDLTAAQNAFQQALALNPLLTEPRLNLALIAMQQGDTRTAQNLLEENQRLAPDDTNTLINLTRLYFETKDSQKLLILTKTVLQKNNDPQTLISLAGLFAERRQFGIAHELYAKAWKIDPKNKNLYRELGKFHGNLGEFDLAITMWQQGQQLDPNDKEFQNLIEQAQSLKVKAGEGTP